MTDSEFMTRAGYVAMLQITNGILAGWFARHWKNGYHYAVIGHTTLIHVRRADEWIKAHGRMKSDEVFAKSIEKTRQDRGASPAYGYARQDKK